MRKAFIILTGMLFTLLFTACKQFSADIDDYLGYWSAEAYIADSAIKAVVQNDVNSIPSVPSAEDVSVTFKLKNPKSFPLDLPPEADAAKNVIVFEHLPQAPATGTDYTLIQSEDRQSLILTYTASFLKAHEWGAQDLSSVLTLYAKDGRKFKQTYTFKLKANTPPPTPTFTVAKTKGSPSYYVLCISVPEMDKTVPGGLVHKDLARIEVNGTGYSFSVNEAQKAFTKPESDSFITHSDVTKLSEPDADEVPTDGWVLYYKTDVEVKEGAAKKDYTVRLADAQGLVSELLNASTKPNKAENETIRITKGTKISGSGSEADPITIGTDSAGAELTASSPTENTTVHCTVSEIDGSTPVKYDGNPVTVPLPLNGAGEKKYKLEYYTDGEGFTATPVRTVYYKVVQGHTVSYRVDGENGKIQAGSGAAVSSGTVSVLHGGSITFTAQPDEGYEVEKWTGAAANTPNTTATLSNVTGDTTVTVKFKKKVYTVTFSVAGGNGSLKGANGTEEKTATTSPVTLTVPHGDSVTFTATPTDPSQYKVGDWTCTPSEGFTGQSGQPTASLTVTADTTVSVQFVPLNALILSKLEIHGVDAQAGSVTLPYTVTQVKKEDISLAFSGQTGIAFTVTESLPLNLTEGTPQSITINVAASPGNYPAWSRIVNITRAKNNVANLKSFTLNGETKNAPFDSEYTVASDTAEVKDFTFDTVSTGATASVSPEGSVSIPVGTGRSFTITVKAQDGTQNTVTFTVKRKKYKVTFFVDGGPGGTLKAKPEGGTESTTTTTGTVSVEHGTQVDFTAEPNEGYEVEKWTGVMPSPPNSTTATLSNVTTNDRTVAVKFKKTVYTVTFSVAAGKGSLKGEGGGHINTATGNTSETLTVPHGENVDFTATPAASGSWEVAGWTKNDAAVNGTNSTYTLSVTGTTTVTVTFYQSEIDGTASMSWKALLSAVRNAPANATIKINGAINATTNYGNNGEIVINKNLTIKGKTGADSDTLNAALQSRIFKVKTGKTLTLENITLKNGGKDSDPKDGGGIYSEGTLTLKNTTIRSCGAKNGGGIYAQGGAEITLTNTEINGCVAKEKGGALYVHGATVKITNCTLMGNRADTDGCAVYAEKKDDAAAAHITIEGGAIKNNTAESEWGSGGGIYINDGCTLTLDTYNNTTGTEISGNKAGNGGGVQAINSTVTMTKCTITGNHATKKQGGQGGGVSTDRGKLTMTDCSITENTVPKVADGGGMAIKDTVVKITNCTIENNEVNVSSSGGSGYGSGGGVRVTGGSFEMTGGTIKGNKAYNGSGVCVNDGSFKMSGVHIENNNTVPNDGRGSGGGVYVSGKDSSFKMTGGTINGNKAQNNSGGGVCVTGGSFTMNGGEISGNTAKEGGGVYVNENATFTMYGGTITDNAGGNKGKGVYLENPGSTFVMGKEACVGKWKDDGSTLEDGNDVYLKFNAIIRIDKNKPITKSKVAHILPYNYGNGRLVLEMTDGSGTTTVADHHKKFTVQPTLSNWEVDSDGKLHAN